jgi:DNA-binding NarL/FixJ family response regulator
MNAARSVRLLRRLPDARRPQPWLAARIEPGTTIAQLSFTMSIAELQALPDIRGWRLGSRPARHRPLSPREGQIVEMVSAGRSHKEIAFELGISNGTVRVLYARAMGKLGRSKHKPE